MKMDPAQRYYPDRPDVYSQRRADGVVEIYDGKGKLLSWVERDKDGNYTHWDGRGGVNDWAVRTRKGNYVTSGQVRFFLNLFDKPLRAEDFLVQPDGSTGTRRARSAGATKAPRVAGEPRRKIKKLAVLALVLMVFELVFFGTFASVLFALGAGLCGLYSLISYRAQNNRFWGLSVLPLVVSLLGFISLQIAIAAQFS